MGSKRALAVGTVLSTTWFIAADSLLSGTAQNVLPALGAIALAGPIPLMLSRRTADAALVAENLQLAQRMTVLDRHVMVNVVDTNGRLVEVNDQLLSATGHRAQDLVGQSVHTLYDDANGRTIASDITEGLKRGVIWQGETPLRRADGSTLHTYTTVIPTFDENGNWTGSISARTDVTQFNKLLAERDSIDALDELRDDVWILDAASGRFTYMNNVALRRLSWRAAELKHRSVDDLEQSDAMKAILSACEDLRCAGGVMSHLETTLFDLPFHVTLKYLPGEGRNARFMIVLNDISERLMEDKNKADFIAMVSHELRSPLTSIKGSMGLLLSRAAGELPQKATALLEIAHRNADRLVLIINDILDLEKISAGNMEFDRSRVDLSALVQETNDANIMLHQRFSLQVDVVGADQPIMVNTDPNRIIQVLNNLISNACKFSKPGGRIEINLEDNGDHVQISVRDEGAGIPPEDQHKIFERFADLGNSNRASKGGTGLGLSICKAIVESLGGKIGFTSQQGKGTTFYFALPKEEGLSGGTQQTGVLRAVS